MPITPALLQPFGFLHGAPLLRFWNRSLRPAASWHAIGDRAALRRGGDHPSQEERSGRRRGSRRGETRRAQTVVEAGYKLYWDVAAYDGDGDVISDGVIVVKVVPKDYLAQKLAERGQA